MLPAWLPELRALRPQEAHTNGFAVERVVGVEIARAVLEAPHHGNIEPPGMAPIQPPDRPQAAGCVKTADGQSPVVTIGQVDHVVVHIGMAGEQLLHGGAARKLLPLLAASQAFLEPAVLYLPRPDKEVEVGSCTGARGGWVGGSWIGHGSLLSERAK